MMKRVLCAAIASVAVHAGVDAAPAATREARIDEIFAPVGAAAPGCAVGVEQNAKTLFAKGYGLADLAEKRPLTPKASVYMASVSKQVTAMATLLLVEDGKIGLDDRVRTIVPELPGYADQVTVRQLLTHNSGLRDFFTLGMGLEPGSYRGLPLVQHGGSLAGYRTMTYWFPTEKLGIVISCNHGEARSGELASKIADIMLDGKLGPAAILGTSTLGEAARAHVGVYRDESGAYLQFALKDGRLVSAHDQRLLAQISPGVFVFPSSPEGTRFTFDANGREVRRTLGGEPERSFVRVNPSDLAGIDYVGDYRSREVPMPFTIRRTDRLLIKLGTQPEARLVETAPDRLWAPDAGIELVFIRDVAGKPSTLLLNVGGARALRYARAGS